MNNIRFAIIGYGNIGKRHAVCIQQHPEARLVAICDPAISTRPDSLASSCRLYQDIPSMLHQEKPDVVNVCTPNNLHHPHTLLALEAGCHVVCEKPMALSSRHCEEMIEAATWHGKTIFVVKQNRYNEAVQQVKQLLVQHQLGRVFQIVINGFWNRNDSYYTGSPWRGTREGDGGCLFTQFSHFVDILYYLFGEIHDCHGQIRNLHHPDIEIEDSGSLYMQTKSGALVSFNFSTCAYEVNMEGSLTVLAEKGCVKIGGQYLNTIEYQRIGSVVLPPVHTANPSNQYGSYQGSMSNHPQVIENVIRTLQGRDTAMTNAHEGRSVVEMIEAMYAGCRL